MRATAAVFEKLFTPLTVAEVEVDSPGPGEALVKVVAAGVCHTDAIARDGDMPFPAPGVLGHEGAGIVAALGSGVTNVAVGDKVVIGWPWCGSCRNCLDGQPRYCLDLGPLVLRGGRADGTTSLRRLDGSPLNSHFFGQSSFASYSVCAARALVVVDPSADIALLGPLACGISTGAGAVLNALRPGAGSSVVIYGAGAVGLSAVMAARLTHGHVDHRGGPADVAAVAGARARRDRDDRRVGARRRPGRGGARDLQRGGRLQPRLHRQRLGAAAGGRLGRHPRHR